MYPAVGIKGKRPDLLGVRHNPEGVRAQQQTCEKARPCCPPGVSRMRPTRTIVCGMLQLLTASSRPLSRCAAASASMKESSEKPAEESPAQFKHSESAPECRSNAYRESCTASPYQAFTLRYGNKFIDAGARHAPCQAGQLALAWPGAYK